MLSLKLHLRPTLRASSEIAVMGEAFRRSFPLEPDLPPEINAALARLSALEAKIAADAVASRKIHGAEKQPVRKPQVA